MKYALVSKGVFGEVCLTGESVGEVAARRTKAPEVILNLIVFGLFVCV